MKLRPYQRRAVNYLRRHEHVLLIAPIGAGKTAIVLDWLRRELRAHGGRALVFGTLRIARDVWPAEARIWAPHLTIESLAGLPRARREARLAESDADILVLNYENLPWLLRQGVPADCRVLVLDEITRGKTPTTVTHRCLRALSERFTRRIGLTGSPTANHLSDLWGQAYLIDGGSSLGRTRAGFLQRYFFGYDNGRWIEWRPRPGAMDAIVQALQGTAWIVSHDELRRELPPVHVVTHALALDPVVARLQQQAERLRRSQDDVALRGIGLIRDGARVLTKYVQLALGRIYDESNDVIRLHDAKFDALDSLLDEAQEPVMIVYAYEHELVEIERRAARHGRFAVLAGTPAQASRVIEAWNNNRVDVLAVHPKSCGHGLNLQHADCHQQIWIAPPPTCDNELYTQTVGRLVRPGRRRLRPVTVHRLVMTGTADEAAWKVIDRKQSGEHALQMELERVLARRPDPAALPFPPRCRLSPTRAMLARVKTGA